MQRDGVAMGSPLGPQLANAFMNCLIRRNFRVDKFSRIFAQNLDLREIARKLVPNFCNFAHENISELNFRKTDPCFSFLWPYRRLLECENVEVREN